MAVALYVAAAAVAQAGESARAILDRAKALEEGERKWADRHERVKLVISGGVGSDRVRELDIFEKKTPKADPHQKQLIVFRSPAEVQGTAFLAHLHRGRAAEQWLYLPALKRIRQIVAQMRNESFVGTDLSNKDLDIIADIVTWTEDDAVATLLDDITLDGVPCHQIALAPKRADIGYAKLVVALGKDDLVARGLSFFDDNGLKKTLLQSKIENAGAIPVGRLVRVETPAANTRTTIEIQSVTFDQGLADDRFTQANLERGEE
jgi:outer membrane lipoprotein-sorting protein